MARAPPPSSRRLHRLPSRGGRPGPGTLEGAGPGGDVGGRAAGELRSRAGGGGCGAESLPPGARREGGGSPHVGGRGTERARRRPGGGARGRLAPFVTGATTARSEGERSSAPPGAPGRSRRAPGGAPRDPVPGGGGGGAAPGPQRRRGGKPGDRLGREVRGHAVVPLVTIVTGAGCATCGCDSPRAERESPGRAEERWACCGAGGRAFASAAGAAARGG